MCINNALKLLPSICANKAGAIMHQYDDWPPIGCASDDYWTWAELNASETL